MVKKVRTRKSTPKKVVVEEVKTIKPSFKIKISKKATLIVLIILIIGGLVYFGGKALFTASVNGQLISRLTVIKELEKQGGKKALDTIILKTLIGQEAKKRKLSISQKELDAELKKIESNVTSQGATLEALLLQQGMTREDLMSEIKMQLLVTKMVDNKVSVTEKEVEDYIASAGQATPGLTNAQATDAIKQQKIQAKIQSFVMDLKTKAKINYFIKY